jgi:hypothetical protein
VRIDFKLNFLSISKFEKFPINGKINFLIVFQILLKFNSERALSLPKLRHSEKGEIDGICCTHKLHLVIIISLAIHCFLLLIWWWLVFSLFIADETWDTNSWLPESLSIYLELLVLLWLPVFIPKYTSVNGRDVHTNHI